MVVLLLGYRVESPGEEGTCKNFLHVQFENERAVKRIKRIYSLEIILALGNKLRSDKGLSLKRWLDEYMNDNDENTDVFIQDNGSVSIDVRVSPEEETVWLTQDQIAKLFDVTRQNVSLHIKSILEEGELYDSVRKKYLHIAPNGREYRAILYNLNMVLSVGYRVKSKRALSSGDGPIRCSRNTCSKDMRWMRRSIGVYPLKNRTQNAKGNAKI